MSSSSQTLGTQDVVVVGAGIAGLSCAHALAQAGHEVTCLEASDTPGGVMRSLRKDGYLFEAGPNSVPASGADFRRLVAEVGLADRLQVSRAEAGTRYLWHGGRLVALPHGPCGLLSTPLLSLGAKLRIMSEPLRRLRGNTQAAPEPSFEEFLTERIGREATRTLAGAFVRGVYASEVELLGARSAFPRLWELAHKHGGLVRGLLGARRSRKTPAEVFAGPEARRTDLLSFPEGLAELPLALAQKLGTKLRLNDSVQELQRGPGGWNLQLESGESIRAAAVVLATPARVTHGLLSLAAPDRLDLDGLYSVEQASITGVHLGLTSAQLPQAFGFLVPPDEPRGAQAPAVLGTLFLSSIFSGRAPEGGSTVTMMLPAAEVQNMGEEHLVRYAHDQLGLAIGRAAAGQVHTSVVARIDAAIPIYSIGHAERISALRRSIRRAMPNLEFAGSWLAGVSVNDCIASGKAAADAILQSSNQRALV